MKNNMTKAQMAEMIAKLSTELEALKAQTSAKQNVAVAPENPKTTRKSAKAKTSAKQNVAPANLRPQLFPCGRARQSASPVG